MRKGFKYKKREESLFLKPKTKTEIVILFEYKYYRKTKLNLIGIKVCHIVVITISGVCQLLRISS